MEHMATSTPESPQEKHGSEDRMNSARAVRAMINVVGRLLAVACQSLCSFRQPPTDHPPRTFSKWRAMALTMAVSGSCIVANAQFAPFFSAWTTSWEGIYGVGSTEEGACRDLLSKSPVISNYVFKYVVDDWAGHRCVATGTRVWITSPQKS